MEFRSVHNGQDGEHDDAGFWDIATIFATPDDFVLGKKPLVTCFVKTYNIIFSVQSVQCL